MLPQLTGCGYLSLDSQGVILNANAVILGWVGGDHADVVGRPLETILSLRMPLSSTGDTPSDATLHGRSGVVRPVVVGLLEQGEIDGPTRLAVFDVSARSTFFQGFRAAEAKTERGRQRLQILLNASVGFADVRTETEAADLLVEVAQQAYSATFVSVHLQTTDGVVQVAGVNPLSAHRPEGHRPTGAITLLNGEVIIVRSPDEADHYVPEAPIGDTFRSSGIQAAIASPLRTKGDALGSMICYFDHPREFDEEAVPLAEALTNQAAQAISRVRLEETLRRAAMHDEVTGLPNRRLFEEEVERVLQSDFRMLAFVFIDLDGFKVVNDRLGHAAGDALLAEVAQRLREITRDRDVLGRFGGDEFIAVGVVDSSDQATAFAERIRASIAEPYDDIPDTIRITASIGVVPLDASQAGVVVDQLVRLADHAMYEAKVAGGDRIALQPA